MKEQRIDKDLRRLLADRVKLTAQEAISAGGVVSREKLEDLERIAKLTELAGTSDVPSSIKRWTFIALFVGALVMVTLLLSVRVSNTQIELEVLVSEGLFTLPTDQVIVDITTLTSIGISGVREIEIAGSQARQASLWKSPEERGGTIKISLQKGARTALSLGALSVSAGTKIRVRTEKGPRHYRMSLEGKGWSPSVYVRGPVLVERSGTNAARLEFSVPSEIRLVGAGKDIDLDLELPSTGDLDLLSQFPISSLSLQRVDEFFSVERPVVKHASTILDGRIYFESIDGQERKIRSGELLQLKGVAGRLRYLRLRKESIALSFQGQVDGMTVGEDDSERSIMPSWLDRLRRKHGLPLLWAAALYLFGMAVSVVRWWRNPG